MSLRFPVWMLSLVTLGLLGVQRGSWLQMGTLSLREKGRKAGGAGDHQEAPASV